MRTVAGPNLSVPQFRVLANIKNGTDMTSTIAELHGISMPAVSKIVDGLVKRHFIERIPQAQDRRVIKLALTDSGRTILENISGAVQKKLEASLEKLDDRECEQLLNGLQVLENFLG